MQFLYILLTFLLLDVLVILHEGGHFLVARASGITVNEFSVGMSPAVFSRVSKKSGVKYSVRAFPIGGFVSMAGEDDSSDDPGAFRNVSRLKRLATVLAGPLVNIAVGFLVMVIVVLMSVPVSTTVAEFTDGSKSDSYGLSAGDRIVKVNSVRVLTGNELIYEIMMQGSSPVDLEVVRDGERIELKGVEFPVITEEGVDFGDCDFLLYRERTTPGVLIRHAFSRSVSTVKMVFDSLGGLLTGRFGLQSVSGPIGISEAVGQAVGVSFASLLYLFAVISVNLGIMNLLPLPVLDGGRILTIIIAMIIRRDPPPAFERAVNTVGFILLMGLTLVITFKDIFKLFS